MKKTIIIALIISAILVIGHRIINRDVQSKQDESSFSFNIPKLDTNNEDAPLIVIDAGHGGLDPGCESKEMNGKIYYEKDITLAIAKACGNRLKELGYRVYYIREDDDIVFLDTEASNLQYRIDLALDQDPDYFLSIHINFSEYNDGARGYDVYLNSLNSDDAMGKSIMKHLNDLKYSNPREIHDDNYYYVLRQNPLPATLVELGFLTDDKDAKYLINPISQVKLGNALANALSENIKIGDSDE